MPKNKTSFKAWTKAARKYAEDNLDLWDFQVAKLASDFAWRNEGIPVTKKSLESAYEDWISGNNPYSPHTLRKGDEHDGVDYEEKEARKYRKNVSGLTKYAMNKGYSNEQAENFIAHIEGTPAGKISLGIYGKSYYPKFLYDWENRRSQPE